MSVVVGDGFEVARRRAAARGSWTITVVGQRKTSRALPQTPRRPSDRDTPEKPSSKHLLRSHPPRATRCRDVNRPAGERLPGTGQKFESAPRKANPLSAHALGQCFPRLGYRQPLTIGAVDRRQRHERGEERAVHRCARLQDPAAARRVATLVVFVRPQESRRALGHASNGRDTGVIKSCLISVGC